MCETQKRDEIRNLLEYVNMSRLKELLLKDTSQMSAIDGIDRAALLRTPRNAGWNSNNLFRVRAAAEIPTDIWMLKMIQTVNEQFMASLNNIFYLVI
jgi:hypothetical protein